VRYDSEVIAETLRLRRRTPILAAPSPIRGDVHIRVERCKGCQLCIECCPTHVLRLSESFNDAGYHHPVVAAADECVCCQGCYKICPEFAIFAVLREAATQEAASGGVPVTVVQRDVRAEVRP
jgi:2-oxoglutarate ferredoxin oxidoreductase subunit delta